MASGLFQAIHRQRLKQVKFLIENGLSANVRNHKGQNPLVAALHVDDDVKRERLFSYLVKQGADCLAYDVSTGRDVFTWCCFLDRTRQAKFVLKHQHGDLDFHQRDTSSHTALHYAAANGNADILQEIVDYMTKYHIAVDIKDADGFTPYILAQRLGHLDCVDILYEAGASHHQMDDKNLKLADEWAWMNERENSFHAHQMHSRRVGMYRLLGRLPELKRIKPKENAGHTSSISTTTTSAIETKWDKQLNANPPKEEAKSAQLFKQSTWLDFEKSRQKHLTKSLPNFELYPIEEGEIEPEPLPRPKAPAPSLHSSSMINIGHPRESEFEDISVNSSTSEDTLFDIMRLVEQQCTHAYRPFVHRKSSVSSSGRPHKLPSIHSKMAGDKKGKAATKLETLAVAKKGKRATPSVKN